MSVSKPGYDGRIIFSGDIFKNVLKTCSFLLASSDLSPSSCPGCEGCKKHLWSWVCWAQPHCLTLKFATPVVGRERGDAKNSEVQISYEKRSWKSENLGPGLQGYQQDLVLHQTCCDVVAFPKKQPHTKILLHCAYNHNLCIFCWYTYQFIYIDIYIYIYILGVSPYKPSFHC